MARFFVSYSRSVKDDVGKVVDLLRASGHEVWWDGDIPIMADWWAAILERIEWCEVFIFVASAHSVESPYCLAELRYANDRQRPVLPFLLDDPATLTLPPDLPPRNQWLLYDGDPAALPGQIKVAYDYIDPRLYQDIDAPRPPEPQKGGRSIAQDYQHARQLANDGQFEEAKHGFRSVKRLDVEVWGVDCDEWIARITRYAGLVDLVADVSTLERAQQAWQRYVREHGGDFDPLKLGTQLAGSPTRGKNWLALASVAVSALIVVIVAGLLLSGNGDGSNTTASPNPAENQTAIAEAAQEQTRLAATHTPTPTNTPSATPTFTDEPTDTPDIPISTLSVNEIAQATVNAFATEQAIRDADATTSAQTTADILTLQAGQTADAIAIATRVAVLQATQTTWTPTATTAPSDTPTVTLTNTHIPTATPSNTPTVTPTNTPTPTSTPSDTPTATPTLSLLEVAQAGVTQNTNWTPLSQHFGGVEMVLVPAGCFMMGSETGSDEERPVHEQCFASPFWIDRYEVTNAQFNASGSYSGPDQPRETINWFGAVRHCEGQRSARLPTEAEWEYAARGPDNLDYAWGSNFDGNRVVYDENSGDQTANVGSYPNNASWVGALDMNGNVFEWVSGRFENYPYRSDSRENFDESNSARTIRGGSWGNTALELRNSYRYGLDPYAQSNFGGFRCARDFTP